MRNFYGSNVAEYGVGIVHAWPIKASAADCRDVMVNVDYKSRNKKVCTSAEDMPEVKRNTVDVENASRK